MKNILFFYLILILVASTSLKAQLVIKTDYMEVTGISNQGLVAGYVNWSGPYYIWEPSTQATTEIGGVAPGNGVGGMANFSDDGNFLSGSDSNQLKTGIEAARYNITDGLWMPLGSLGYTIDNVFSSGYNISGNGNVVVGNSWANPLLSADTTAFTHGFAWVAGKGVVDLGSLYDSIGSNARANAVSADGSIIVGWQDTESQWKSAVWYRNPDSTYAPNIYLLKNSTSGNIQSNRLGQCTAISGSGAWIGGEGDDVNSYEPWIWNNASGFISLGNITPANPTAQGYVAGLSYDGSIAVGRINQGPWDPEIAFIWTANSGLQSLDSFAINTLQINLGTKSLYSASKISPNGRYICGYGMDNSDWSYFTYRLELPPAFLTEVQNNSNVKIYPNPFTNDVSVTFLSEEASIVNWKIYDMTGKLVLSGDQKFSSGNNEMKIDGTLLPKGVYTLTTLINDKLENVRLIKQ
jgi:uncharacterized membrane protein